MNYLRIDTIKRTMDANNNNTNNNLFQQYDGNQIVNDNERIRRQQLLRFTLMICMLFLLLSNDQGNSKNRNDNNSSSSISKSDEMISRISLKDEYNKKLNNILQSNYKTNIYDRDPFNIVTKDANDFPINVTGLYRGAWMSYDNYDLMNIDVDSNNNNQKHHVNIDKRFIKMVDKRITTDSSSSANNPGTSSSTAGSSLMQLVTVPIKDVTDLCFVYGIIRLYQNDDIELAYPLQGVFVNSQRKLTLFATPYESQQLYIAISSPSTTALSTTSNTSFTSTVAASIATQIMQDNNHGSYRQVRNSNKRRLDSNDIHEYKQQTFDVSDLFNRPQRGTVRRKLLNTEGLSQLPLRSISNSMEHSEDTVSHPNSITNSPIYSLPSDYVVFLTEAGHEYGEIKLILSSKEASNALKKEYNTTNNNSISITTDLFQLGVNTLPSKFKALQTSTSPPIPKSPSATNSSSNQQIKKTSTQCPYSFQLTVLPHDEVIDQISQYEKKEQNHQEQQSIHTSSKDKELLAPTSSTKMISANAIGGGIASSTCSNNLQVFATSYEIHIDQLKSKVEAYSLSIGLVCFLQILLLIYLLNKCSTFAFSSRISIVSVFLQSLLDALLCMGHLLLSLSIPNVFFASFIWISLTKLILFSVFHMKVIISIYQARFSQEISSEGWLAFRNRLIQLHLRFYAAIFICILLSYALPYSPTIIILGLYSFWIPQIIYSAYSGTKYPMSIVYVASVTVLRWFIPMYLLACPYSFLTLLSAYIEPPSHLYIPGVLRDTVKESYMSYSASFLLIVWTSAQVLIMYYQSKYGPRFFVPKSWLPLRYDYNRTIPVHLLRGNSSTTSTGSSNSSDDHLRDDPTLAGATGTSSAIELTNHHHHGYSNDNCNDSDIETGLLEDEHGIECVICYNNIHVNTRNYMITPCDHIFHEECLLQWIDVKLECPVCRHTLPPTEN